MKIITLILLLIAVLVTAYFIMQADDRAVVSQLNPVSTVIPVTPAQSPAPAVLSESGSADANEVNETPHGPSSSITGKPLEPGIRDAVRELVNTSHEGLVEEKTDNGVEMKLKGRFRTAPVATVDENGEVTVRDYTSPPAE